jgi:hypothetical protein
VAPGEFRTKQKNTARGGELREIFTGLPDLDIQFAERVLLGRFSP